ncbi:MAG: hypothetical protein H6609_07750 [Ignavibacteriales bacterium]|nr:hypothetical protein [Ignavibacteriales bacterium]
MNFKKKLKIFFIFFFTCSLITSQSLNYKNLTFEHLSIEHGLSQITVHAILQDSKGFLWFGTEDGLNRYDGYNFTIFRHDPMDSNSISDNFIWSLFEDSENNIWIGTNSGGLNKYNYSTNAFTNFLNKNYNATNLSGNNIREIFEDSDKELWIGTNNYGLFKFSKSDNSFSKVNLLEQENVSIRALCQDKAGLLWIGTNENGLFTYNKSSNFVEQFMSTGSKILQLNSNSIWALSCDSKNNIFIGTYNDGLFKYDRKLNSFSNFKSSVNSNSLVNNNVTSILIDNYDNAWICTEDGLSIYLQQSNEFINYKHNLSDLRSLSNSFLRYIIKDHSDLIWIGTVAGGVNKININKKFNQFNHDPTDDNSLSHNMIRAIEEDSKGNIWIGTLGNGITRFNKYENKFQRFNSSNVGLSVDVVTAIFEDKDRNIWVGTWGGGLNKIEFYQSAPSYKIKNIKVYNHRVSNNNSLSSNIIQDIFEDNKGNLWIGTEDGLDKLNPAMNIIQHFRHDPNDSLSLSDNRIQSNCILQDRYGYLWIGTWQGLNRINILETENNKEASFFKIYKSNGLSDNRVISIFEDKNNINSDSLIIWAGTIGGGLNKINLLMQGDTINNYKITNYTEKDGLPSNVIYGILGDDEGNLWMSTNNGISKFSLNKNQFRNYDIKDGLQSNQFFWGAFHKTKDGELYFGGINGMNSFYPNKLIENQNIPPVFITKCNIESSDGTTRIILDNIDSIKNVKQIELSYDSYNIQFEFTALDLTTPSKNMYKYILENYDEKWVENNFSHVANYTNVNDGNYDFKVLGSNNDGIWNNEGAVLSIIVKTPFWKTWWFILLVIGFISSIIIYIVTAQVKNILAVERLRTKLAADLHDNIGSSLTEISILSEVISTKLKTEEHDIIKNLNKISNKSRSLIDKMSDIVWLVNPQRDSLYDLILRLQDTYSDLLSDTEISFRSENLKSLEKVSLTMEHRQHLFLIFKEAINNSITHSKCSEIILNANVNGRTLIMILKDNGIGLDTSQENLGNGLKNMQSRAKKIGGKLSINSDVGKGTTVTYIGNIR